MRRKKENRRDESGGGRGRGTCWRQSGKRGQVKVEVYNRRKWKDKEEKKEKGRKRKKKEEKGRWKSRG